MKLSLTKFLILSLTIFLAACHGPKNCIRTDKNATEIVKPVIALDSSTPVLYSADFEILKYHFSGLIAFRKMPENTETRIVFLTETGIRIMEFRYDGIEVVNTYKMEAIKKESIIKFIGSFLQLLLQEPVCKGLCTYSEDAETNYFGKTKNGYYTCTLNNGRREEALLFNSRKKQANARYELSQSVPDEINVIMPMRTNIQMKRAINAFK